MTPRPLYRLIAAALVILVCSAAQAQQGVPAARFLHFEDTDLPGGDLSTLLDTTREGCERACMADAA